MKADTLSKSIRKQMAAQAAQAPLRSIDEGLLAREVEAAKDRAARREEQRRLLSELEPLTEPQSIAEAMPDAAAEFAAMASRFTPMTPSEERACSLKMDVVPRLEAWGFEKRFQREISTWNCEEQEATFQVCREKLCGIGAVVALIGKRGAGKTTIAAQLAIDRAWRELAARKERPGVILTFRYMKLPALVRRFKPLYANFGSTNTESLSRSLEWICKEDDVLVIDEMHDLSELAVREAMLIDIIDRRYAGLLDTLLISNQTEEEFESTPDSIRSRIQEHGCVLKCEWDSWREKTPR